MVADIRLANVADLAALRALDGTVFPQGDNDREPAAAGEIEAGIAASRLLVASRDGVIVGFLQFDQVGSSNIDLVSLAVSPAAQRHGVGRALLQRFLNDIARGATDQVISVVTSPRNVGMLALLTSNGFVVLRGIRDYFGAGKDRVYCQFDVALPGVDPQDRMVIPVQAVDYLYELLADDEYVVREVVTGAQGEFFEVWRVRPEDRAALRANEAAISVSESGSIVAGFAFILGLSFVVPDFSDALRIVLLFATIVTVGALAIFANSSGNLARIRDDSFDDHMKWANLLLEFGGLYPFVIALSAVFAHADRENYWIAFASGIGVSALVAAYEYSPFSLSRRYRGHWYLQIAIVLTVLLPVAYPPIALLTGDETVWVVLVVFVLIARCVLHVSGGNRESRRPVRARPRLDFRRRQIPDR